MVFLRKPCYNRPLSPLPGNATGLRYHDMRIITYGLHNIVFHQVEFCKWNWMLHHEISQPKKNLTMLLCYALRLAFISILSHSLIPGLLIMTKLDQRTKHEFAQHNSITPIILHPTQNSAWWKKGFKQQLWSYRLQ